MLIVKEKPLPQFLHVIKLQGYPTMAAITGRNMS
jgi:hypothetical protein